MTESVDDSGDSRGAPVFQDPLLIPVGVQEREMAEVLGLVEQMLSQGMAQLQQTGLVAQNNFVTANKLADYDYFENKRVITTEEALGQREVAATHTPGGPAPRV